LPGGGPTPKEQHGPGTDKHWPGIATAPTAVLVFSSGTRPTCLFCRTGLFPTPANRAGRPCALGGAGFLAMRGLRLCVGTRLSTSGCYPMPRIMRTNQSLFARPSRPHMDEMGRRVMARRKPGMHLDILEVGCGQGVFLRRLAALGGGKKRPSIAGLRSGMARPRTAGRRCVF